MSDSEEEHAPMLRSKRRNRTLEVSDDEVKSPKATKKSTDMTDDEDHQPEDREPEDHEDEEPVPKKKSKLRKQKVEMCEEDEELVPKKKSKKKARTASATPKTKRAGKITKGGPVCMVFNRPAAAASAQKRDHRDLRAMMGTKEELEAAAKLKEIKAVNDIEDLTMDVTMDVEKKKKKDDDEDFTMDGKQNS